jgi:hypothetical protein
MGARSLEDLPEALPHADPTVVPPIVDLTGEQPFAELTEGPSIAVVRIMVAFTIPITGPVPSRRVSQLGRPPAPQRHRAIATTRLIATHHRTTIRHTNVVILFFVFQEIGRVIGKEHLREMLFTKDYSLS